MGVLLNGVAEPHHRRVSRADAPNATPAARSPGDDAAHALHVRRGKGDHDALWIGKKQLRIVHEHQQAAAAPTTIGVTATGRKDCREEATAIVTAALKAPPADPWAAANATRERLNASGRAFSDSTELLREDRDQ